MKVVTIKTFGEFSKICVEFEGKLSKYIWGNLAAC